MMKKILKWVFLFCVLAFLYLPILILTVYSFTDATQIGAKLSFSLDNYITLATTEELRSMILGTILLALGVAVIAAVLGTIGAIGAFYSRRRTYTFVSVMNQIPVVNAEVVTAFSLCVLLVIVFGVSKDTFIPLVIGQVTLCAPFVYLSVMPRLTRLDASTYEAALDLGATPFQALTKVVLPQIFPGIASGFMLSITLSLDDYFIATYLKPATFDTISTYVVNATKGSQTRIKTALWALSSVIFFIVILIVLLFNLRSAHKSRGREQDGGPGPGGRIGGAYGGGKISHMAAGGRTGGAYGGGKISRMAAGGRIGGAYGGGKVSRMAAGGRTGGAYGSGKASRMSAGGRTGSGRPAAGAHAWKMMTVLLLCLAAAAGTASLQAQAAETDETKTEKVVLRICNWEEYIDEGDWDEDEVIDLESGDIFGENSLIEDFEAWYYETYGIEVTVEYSTFGTNEDLYNMLSMGDVYDLVCPSEYLFMMLMAEDALVPLSEDFFDETDENNYYIRGVSSFIREIFDSHTINGESWSTYAAGYMWGVTGIVYNPEYVTREEASTWSILVNEKFYKQITVKDSVREGYFAAVGALKADLLTSDSFINDENYSANLEAEMNDTSEEMIAEVGEWLAAVKENAYSFETDSGKADMITGKVVANAQWSGDAVYTMEQAEEDGVYLEFAMPVESSNIYFDGWVMLKSGIGDDEAKQHAAEAFINFLSRPDNAVRNMYYIGYTSCIAGSEDDTRIFEYVEWYYGADEDEEDTTEYALGYFFSGDNEDEDYIITTATEQLNRQLFAQYPDAESIERTSIMVYFDSETNAAVNDMWVQVRCFSIYNVPIWAWVITACVIAAGAGALLYRHRRQHRTYNRN